MIRAVLFDIDGVLLDSFKANFDFYTELLRRAGYPKPTEEEFKKAMHFTYLGTIQALAKISSSEEIQRIADLGKDFTNNFYRFDLLKTPMDVAKIIETLNESYKIGIVTNRIKSAIYTMPQLKRLKKYFSVAVAFEDTKMHKPNPEPLLFACKKLNIKPGEAVYVGDAESDFLAAKASEMKFILFAKTDFLHADNHTSSFQELPEIIASLL